MVYNYL